MKIKIDDEIQNRWDYLVNHFTANYIASAEFNKEEYVEGLGRKQNFCYLVEAGTKDLGEIRGSTASKFGLWYGIRGKDKKKMFRATKQYFNSNVDVAFSKLKLEISRLITETIKLTKFKDLDSIISPMFKYKIMYLYNPDIMLPSFVLEDLQYFEARLKLRKSDTFEKAQNALLKYRKVNYPNKTNHEFMAGLYSEYGKYDFKRIRENEEIADNELNKKILFEKSVNDDYETHPVEKAKLKETSRGSIYPRNPKVAAIALAKAKYKCENVCSHECFIKRNSDLPYTEVHHLVPLAYHSKFEKSLDVPENIVSLCSNCHNEIHYGKDADVLIAKLFNERKDKLHLAGIDVTLNELLTMYHKLGKYK